MMEHNLQIDLVKTFAILSVILLHSVSESTLFSANMVYYAWQAVPLFIICTGILWYLSFANHATTLRNAYSMRYFKNKFNRIIIPFLVIFTLDLIYMYYNGITIRANHILSRLEWLQPPISGAGDYYLALVWQLIFISPLLCYFFSKKPVYTVVGLFIANLAFELVGPYISFDLYYFSICRYLAAFALGLVLAHNVIVNHNWHLKSRVNLILIVLGLLSAVYLYFFLNAPTPGFRPEWRTQNIYSFFYPTLIIMLFLSAEPLIQGTKRLFYWLTVFGRASYHIFLVQIIYFGFGIFRLFDVSTEFEGFLVNLAVTFSFGLLFYGINSLICKSYSKWLWSRQKENKHRINVGVQLFQKSN